MPKTPKLSSDARVFLEIMRGKSDLNWWIFGIQIQRLRPDIAERIIRARDELARGDPEFEAITMRLTIADDNFMQAVIEMFETGSAHG